MSNPQTTLRSYTLDEIDGMREAIRWSYPCGVSYNSEERNREIEDRLRTYMLAGVIPEDLYKKRDERIAWQQQNAR